MNDFQLPIIKAMKTEKRVLSMDEYLQFILFNIEHTLDKNTYDKWKKLLAVNAPFSLSNERG